MSCRHIAMWSGPRNLSTAMMYSFAQRTDCEVLDEPYYAAYLKDTGLKHALYQEIIAAGLTNPNDVARLCSESKPTKLCYQKHITKHLLPDYPTDWFRQVSHAFLIRHPARVICSYHLKDENPDLSDIGVEEQWRIYQIVAQNGQQPLVVDSADILAQPEKMLIKICAALNIKFQPEMLHWPQGPKPYDGVWAPHWYHSVWKSTGFDSRQSPLPQVPEHLQPLLEEAMPWYDKLKSLSLKATEQ